MEFGVAYPARLDAWKDLIRAEELGFSYAWFYDSQMLYSDVYACLALAAEHTKTIKLGTGVAIPSSRLAPSHGALDCHYQPACPRTRHSRYRDRFYRSEHYGPAARPAWADPRIYATV